MHKIYMKRAAGPVPRLSWATNFIPGWTKPNPFKHEFNPGYHSKPKIHLNCSIRQTYLLMTGFFGTHGLHSSSYSVFDWTFLNCILDYQKPSFETSWFVQIVVMDRILHFARVSFRWWDLKIHLKFLKLSPPDMGGGQGRRRHVTNPAQVETIDWKYATYA